MRKTWILVPVLILYLAATSALGQTFGAALTGSQEPDGGDPDGFGTATVSFSADRTQLFIDVTFSGIGTTITGAHIHEGAFGVNGPVRIGFINSTMTITNGRINATISLSDPTIAGHANNMAANPGNFYVNVHTPQFPGGAIRGQLNATAVTVFANDLRGSREVPGPGHPTATGSFVLTLSGTTVTFAIATQGLGTITNSHVHAAAEGVQGDVFFGLASGSAYVNGVATGTVQITTQQAAAVLANPANFYVNVHTTDFPAGAIRGQLVLASAQAGTMQFLPVIGRVSNATDTFVTDVRIFNPSFEQSASVTIEFYSSTGQTLVRTVTIAPRGTAVLNNIVGDLFGQNVAIGGARITSPFRVVASSRIFADRRGTGGGTIGQFFPAVSQPLRRGILPGVSHVLSSTTGLRTNIGLFNQNDAFVFVRLELRDAQGALVATSELTLAPRSFRQDAITTIFPSITSLADGSVTFEAGAPIIVYASVVDNVSTDAVAVIPVEDPFSATAP